MGKTSVLAIFYATLRPITYFRGDSMRIIRGKKFSGESFVLEETVFIDCTLENCDLFYSGGDFEWSNTKFLNCQFRWRGGAKNTVVLLIATGLLKPEAKPAPPATMPPSTSVQ
jgi:hypothetical protein